MQFAIENEKYKTDLSFKKVDENHTALSGAEFELFSVVKDSTGTAEKKIDGKTSQADGEVLFENVRPEHILSVNQRHRMDTF